MSILEPETHSGWDLWGDRVWEGGVQGRREIKVAWQVGESLNGGEYMRCRGSLIGFFSQDTSAKLLLDAGCLNKLLCCSPVICILLLSGGLKAGEMEKMGTLCVFKRSQRKAGTGKEYQCHSQVK